MLSKSTFYLTIVACTLASCSNHFYYAPNTLHMPTTKVVGETTIEASLNGSEQTKGGELKLAYMPLPKTSVMANAMMMSGSFSRSNFSSFPTPPPEQHSAKTAMGEMGITRHFPMSEYTDFTLTAGGGLGQATNHYDRGRMTELNYNRVFLQPAFVTKGELANIGIGLRYSRLSFHSASVDAAIDEGDLDNIQEIERKGSFMMPEIGVTAGINYAPFHINCNAVLSLYNGLGDFAFNNTNLNVSLRYDLLPKGRKKEKTAKKSKK